VQVFKQGITSYRDLPVRLAEFGKCHRYEPSGALHGMMRVRAFTQDDAHIFCTPEQITDESIAVCKLILRIYRDFGFEDVRIKFADRPEVRVGEDSQKHAPVMLHRALFGSLERFIGILIEHHAGRLPAWLAPVQAVVLNITEAQEGYCHRAVEFLKNQGLRVETDLRNEKVGFKIREHTLQRVPYLLVAGDREAGSESLAVRTRAGKDLGAMPLEAIARGLAGEVASRGRTVLEV
jgi:threonyl-tRNA synthetase